MKKTMDFIFKKALLKEVFSYFGNNFILKKLNRSYFYASIETDPIDFLGWAKDQEIYILEED